MDYTLEAYVNYNSHNIPIDIAYEGFSDSLKRFGRSIVIAIRSFIRKMITCFSNFILNVNYFKNAYINENMSRDLIKMLKIMEPRTLIGVTILPKIWQVWFNLGQNPDKHKIVDGFVGRGPIFYTQLSTLDHEMKKTFEDLDNSKKAVETSDEYKRYTENNYQDGKDIAIPLTHIIPDMKDSRKSLTECEIYLEKIENKADLVANDNDLQKSFNKITNLLKSLISYYQLRISLLSKFFNTAKASLNATMLNIKERNNEDYMSRNTNNNHDLVTPIIKIVPNYEMVKEAYDNAIETNKNRDPNGYVYWHDKLTSLLRISNNVVFNILSLKRQGSSARVALITYDDVHNKVLVTGRNLYHVQKIRNDKTGEMNPVLKELKPSGYSLGGIFYPKPRVYLHIGYPLDRAGKMIGTFLASKNPNDWRVYIVSGNIPEVYNDTEMGRTACYVETTGGVPVKVLDYNKFKADMEDKITSNVINFDTNKI